jgi:hypothetical protein
MSLLPLTPVVIQALRTDFRQGTWSSITQRFFQQLFDRVGGSSAPTNADLTAEIDGVEALVTAQQAEIVALESLTQAQQDEIDALAAVTQAQQAEIDALEAALAALSPGDFGLAPAREDAKRDDDLTPRRDLLPADFGLERVP